MMASVDTHTLADRIEALAADERAILEVVLSRMEAGRGDYGPWNVSDGRDYASEALQEVIDALHYSAAQLVRLEREGSHE